MKVAIDILSERSGLPVTHTEIRMRAAEPYTADQVRHVVRCLNRTRKELLEGNPNWAVRVRFDEYHGALFWHLLLRRPVEWRGQTAPLCEFLVNRSTEELYDMNLGILYDKPSDLALVVWDHAHAYIRELSQSASWNTMLARAEAKSKEKLDFDWWRRCALSSSFSVHGTGLREAGVLDDFPLSRIEGEQSDIIGFQMAGLFLVEKEAGEVVLPAPKRIHAPNLIEVPEKPKKKSKAEERRLAKKRAKQKKEREKEQEAQRQWRAASLLLKDVCGALGIECNKRKRVFRAPYVQELFEESATKYEAGHYDDAPLNRELILKRLADIERVVDDPYVPVTFKRWLRWREFLRNVG